jgi:hypothetical protein
MEPERGADVHGRMRRLNPTLIALLLGIVILILLVAYFASSRNPDQDKLKDAQVTTAAPASSEKRCASQQTYDLIKRELFRRAAQLRGSDQAAYDRLAAYAVARMENPVLESENKDTGAVNCSGSLSLDLPPGVEVVGGRRTLMSDVDYTVQPAADGSGNVVLLRNADAIITPLATLARVAQPAPSAAPPEANAVAPEQPSTEAPAPQPPAAAPPPAQPPPPRPSGARASFDCAKARTRGEVAVCSDAGLATLDRNMAAQYARAVAQASPEQRDILRDTAHRFYAYRDRCPNNACIGDAYVGRMREIRDIMEGRWQPPR